MHVTTQQDTTKQNNAEHLSEPLFNRGLTSVRLHQLQNNAVYHSAKQNNSLQNSTTHRNKPLKGENNTIEVITLQQRTKQRTTSQNNSPINRGKRKEKEGKNG